MAKFKRGDFVYIGSNQLELVELTHNECKHQNGKVYPIWEARHLRNSLLPTGHLCLVCEAELELCGSEV